MRKVLVAGLGALSCLCVCAQSGAEVPEVVTPNGHHYRIWLNSALQGTTTKPPLTQGDISRYCTAAEVFAQRMWQLTNGRHKIFQVEFIYQATQPTGHIDGQWHRNDAVANGPPGEFVMYDGELGAAHTWTETNGVISIAPVCPPGLTVVPLAGWVNRERCRDPVTGNAPLESGQEAGWVLAHEASHSHYDLIDEYYKDSSDPILYGFRVCKNPEWFTSLMADRESDLWCDVNTHLHSRFVNTPFEGQTPITYFVSQGDPGDQWTIAKLSWADLMSYDPGPAFTQEPGAVPENDYFVDAADPWQPDPNFEFCVFNGDDIASAVMNDIVVVVDKSGSMNYRYSPLDQTAFQAAFSAGLQHFNRTPAQRKAGLTVFDSVVTRTIPYSPFDGTARAIEEFPIMAGGNTDLCQAITNTVEQIRTSGTADSEGHMVLLTDGRPTVPGCDTAEQVQAAAREACVPANGGKRVVISTLAFGDADFALIQRLADICGGDARQSDGSGSPDPVPPGVPPGSARPLSIKVAASRLGYQARHYTEAMFAQEPKPLTFERSFDVPPGTAELELTWMGERTAFVPDPGPPVVSSELEAPGVLCEFEDDYGFEVLDPNGNLAGADVVPPATELGYLTRSRRVLNPQAGHWTMRMTGGAPCVVGGTQPAPQVAMFAVYRNSLTRARVKLDKSVIASNERTRVTAVLQTGLNTASTNLSVAAKLVNGSTALSLPMFDDGANGGDAVANDGMYTAAVNPSCAPLNLMPGGYRLVVELTSNQATAIPVPYPDPDVQQAMGAQTTAVAPPISASVVEEKLFTVLPCNSPTPGCTGPAPTNLCPQQEVFVDNPTTVPAGGTLTGVSVTVKNCPIARNGVTVGVGPGVYTSNVQSSYDSVVGEGTVTFDLSVTPRAPSGENQIAVFWGRERCDTTGATIPVCRELPQRLPNVTLAVCAAARPEPCGHGRRDRRDHHRRSWGHGHDGDHPGCPKEEQPTPVKLDVPRLVGGCLPGSSVSGRVISTDGEPLDTPLAVSLHGNVELSVGTHVVEWIVTATNGVTQSTRQTVYVLPAFAANGTFSVGEGASLEGDFGRGAALANAGSGLTRIDRNADVGSVLSVGDVELRGADVHGFVRTRGELLGRFGSNIDGFVEEQSDLVLGGVKNPPVDFPDPVGSDVLVNGRRPRAISVGAYGRVNVARDAELVLQGGDYLFDALELEHRSKVRVQSSTRLFVKSSVRYRGAFVDARGRPARTYLAYYGTAPLLLESGYEGVLLADSARAVIGDYDSKSFSGQFLAKDIEVKPHVKLSCSSHTDRPLASPVPAVASEASSDETGEAIPDGETGCACRAATRGEPRQLTLALLLATAALLRRRSRVKSPASRRTGES